MRKRSQARELALTILYQCDLLGRLEEEQIERHLRQYAEGRSVRQYAQYLVESCLAHRDELDRAIAAVATNWELHRMGAIERNVLRLGAYELLYERENVPYKVAIDEAIELAKRFGTEQAGAFVNGILDKIRIQHCGGNVEIARPEAATQAGEKSVSEREEDITNVTGFADLHVHTDASDGVAGPVQIANEAAAAGLAAIAVCDHDCVDGIEATTLACAERGIRVVAGIELSCSNPINDGTPRPELHIVGLFIRWRDEQLRNFLAGLVESRRKRVHAIAERLRQLGVKVFPERIIHDAGKSVPGRMHVAEELRRIGAVATLQEAFDKFIGDGGPAYVPKPYLSYSDAIEMIHGLGGAAILAHPCLSRADDLVRDMAAVGLDGLEVYYPTHTESDQKRYNAMCEELGLLPSGGSDFHGSRKPDIQIGKSRVPAEMMLHLYERALRYRRAQ